MDTNGIQEFRYSVTDVIIEDAEDIDVSDEYKAMFQEYCAEIDLVAVDTPLWCALDSYYKSCMLTKDRHKAYTKSLLCSGDNNKINAAIEAMKRTLLKLDTSPAVAKQNKEAYAAREQQRLREKSAPKIRAWEERVRAEPYFPDAASWDAEKKRQEALLMARVEAYHHAIGKTSK